MSPPFLQALAGLLRLPAAVVGGADRSFWMPVQAASEAGEVDFVFRFIFWVSVFFFALIVVLMTVFVLRYRWREGREAESQVSHNMWLETTWSVIPLILVVVIFWMGFKGFMRLSVAPKDAYEVQVTGQKWNWLFTYPNGYVDANLHVPVDRPVRLNMTSEDVIHSFYVPAFRVKRDVVPGRYSQIWFRATLPGTYTVFCTEYCGTSHSDMLAEVVVHPPGEFEKWLEEASNFLDTLPPAEAGELLYKQRGCAACHRVDGGAMIGPSFLGLYGAQRAFVDGSTATADENYIRQSILYPQAQIVAGFEPVMPTYQGRLKDKEITAIIEYIKTLKP